jgi:protein-arginine kinase activator protein McsA
MKQTCTQCGKETTQPVTEVTREGVVITVGPVCQACWEKISRAIDDEFYRNQKEK